MIAAQGLDISFVGLLQASAIPALLSLPLTWLVLVWLYRNRWYLTKENALSTPPQTTQETLNVWETAKLALLLSQLSLPLL